MDDHDPNEVQYECIRVIVYRGPKDWVRKGITNRWAQGMQRVGKGVVQEIYCSRITSVEEQA